jgi:hypothetical protein
MIIIRFAPTDPYMYPGVIETDQPTPTSEEDVFEEYFSVHGNMVGFDTNPEDEDVDDWEYSWDTEANREKFRNENFPEYTVYEHFKWCYILFGTDSIDEINAILDNDPGEYNLHDFEEGLKNMGFYFIKLGRDNGVYIDKKMEAPEFLVYLLQSKETIDYEKAVELISSKSPNIRTELEALGFDWALAAKLSKRARMLERE